MSKRVYFCLDNMFEEIVTDECAADEERLRRYLISQLEYNIQALNMKDVEICIDEILDEEEEE